MFMETLGLCQTLNVLPKPGGLHDQDSLYVHYLVFALTYQNERQQLDAHSRSTTNS